MGRKIAVGFAAVFAVLLVISSVSYRATNQLIETTGLVTHSYAVLDQLSTVVALLDDAESAARGYVISGQHEFLEPYHAALRPLEDTMATLRDLTADNVHQQRRRDALEKLVQSKLELTARIVELRDSKVSTPRANSSRRETPRRSWTRYVR
ncbi:MAG: CHASE3 domain-containing protein [Deltaproteobacteria bacterium]|nr:CHASE3 domain-containing protein [Deltaproteobacteria bacterium]